MGQQIDGGQAFPSSEVRDEFGDMIQPYKPGMTLRDWFAGQALQGLLAATTFTSIAPSMAYEIADNMLQVRSK